MDRFENIAWIYYIDQEQVNELDENKVGKWMYFFKDSDFADEVCKKAVETGVVAEAKHSNASDGVCCFYLNCDDIAAHKRCIQFFQEHELIRRTKSGRLYNISFKLDAQTRDGEYGNEFKGTLKLADFIDLNTGAWIRKDV